MNNLFSKIEKKDNNNKERHYKISSIINSYLENEKPILTRILFCFRFFLLFYLRYSQNPIMEKVSEVFLNVSFFLQYFIIVPLHTFIIFTQTLFIFKNHTRYFLSLDTFFSFSCWIIYSILYFFLASVMSLVSIGIGYIKARLTKIMHLT